MAKKITKRSILGDVLNNPRTLDTLKKYDFPCLSCPFASSEAGALTIGQIAKIYKINLDKLLRDLNKNVKNEK